MAETPSRSLRSFYASSSRRHPVIVFIICGLLLMAFAVLSFTAELGKCATSDEPMHGLAAYILKEYDDYRFNSEDPALWQHWTGLAEPAHALKLDFNDPRLTDILSDWGGRWRWIGQMLYMTPGNDPDTFLRRERFMLIPLGVLLGALMAFWSWRLAGGVAAVTAAVLFAFDPNFLAHSAQIKNDVPITLTACALAFTAWQVGRRLSGLSLLALIFTASLPMVVKFSGPLQIIFLALLLAFRVILPIPWNCFGRQIRRWYAKAAVAGGALLLCGLAAYLTIWASYSFRFAPTADGSQWVFKPLIIHTAIKQVSAAHPELTDAPLDEVRAWKPDTLVGAIEFCNQHRLLPQTFLYGMLYTYQSAFIRGTFLCGRLAKTGCWQYFPLAYLFKTPIASQIAVLIGLSAVIAAWVSMLKLARHTLYDQTYFRLWDAASLAIPFAVLFTADLRSKLDLGIRHMLPVYPLLFIMAAIGVAMMIKRFRDRGKLVAIGLAVALVAETAFAFPNYIAFFNAVCGGSRGGLRLLSDSNLDWGQDLPALAQWQREHPDRNLYLCYFGTADPVYYGIRYKPLPHTMALRDHDLNQPMPREPGVIAISATALQGNYLPPGGQFVYGLLRENQTPIAVLNGSIYLYEYDPPH